MQSRAVRLTLVIVIAIVSAAAAVFLQTIDRRARDLRDAHADLSTRLDAAADSIAAIRTAQQNYTVPGQRRETWFEAMSGHVRQLYDEIAGIRPRVRASSSAAALQALSSDIDTLIAADARARENLRLGQDLMAADVIVSDSRATLDTMLSRVRDIGRNEQSAAATADASLTREQWIVFGSAATAWLIVALVLALTKTKVEAAQVSPVEEQPVEASAPHDAASVNLAAAADVCTALARLTDATELPALLSRAADIVDASGIILWMGAGDELFAVSAHGYTPAIISRLGAIARHAENATAAAWRTGSMTTVAADGSGNGAIVAPIFAVDGCIGALAVEVRGHREHDPATRAVVTMIAAQLATTVSAWPATSSAEAKTRVG